MICGSIVTLRPAEMEDRRPVYEWLAESDVTPSMMGPPSFPEISIPTFREFCADYQPLFFDGTQPRAGRSYIIECDGDAVGHVSFDRVGASSGIAELDIWLRSEAVCGRGYGSDALAALTAHLNDTLGIAEFMMRPSLQNERAIKAYAKAGFSLLPISNEEQATLYGEGEFADTAVLYKKVDGNRDSGSTSRDVD